MKFARLKRTLNELQVVNNANFEDLLAIINDAMSDIQAEMCISPMNLEITEAAVQSWMTILRPILKAPVEKVAQQMIEKQQVRVKNLNVELNNKATVIEELSKEFQEKEGLVKKLEFEIKELKDKREANYSLEKKANELTQEINQLNKELELFQDIDINIIQKKKDELLEEIQNKEKLEKEFKEADEKLTEVKKILVKKQQIIDNYKNNIKNTLNGIETLDLDIQLKKEEYEKLENKKNSLTKQCEDLKLKINTTLSEKTNIENSFVVLQDEFKNLIIEYDQEESKYNGLKMDKEGLEKQLDKLKETIRNIQERNKVTENEIRVNQGILQKLQKNLVFLVENIDDLKIKNQNISSQINVKEQEYNIIKKENEELNNKLLELTARLNEAKQKKEEASLEHKTKTEELEETQKNINSIIEECNKYQEELNEIKIRLISRNEEYDIINQQLTKEQTNLAVKNLTIQSLYERIQSLTLNIEKAKQKEDASSKECTELEDKYNQIEKKAEGFLQKKTELQKKIEKVDADIERLSEEEQEMINEINEKSRLIEEANPEKLKNELISINQKIKEQKTENNNLSEKKNESKKAFEDLLNEKNEIIAKIGSLEKQISKTKEEKNNYETEKKKQENKYNILLNDIKVYEEFFNTEQFKAETQQIDNFIKVVQIYEDAVQRLFSESIPAKYFLDKAIPYLNTSQTELKKQLDEINNSLKTLNMEYIKLIEETERTVNQYAV